MNESYRSNIGNETPTFMLIKTTARSSPVSPFLMELLQGGARLLLKRANGTRYIEHMVAHGFFSDDSNKT